MIHTATYNDKPLVIDILTKTFDKNKSVNYVVKNDSKRIDRIQYLMDYSFEMCWHYGNIYLSEDKTAVALIMNSSEKKSTLRTVWLDVKLATRSIGITRIYKVLKRETYIKKHRTKETYLYFWFFGVLPEKKGNGSTGLLKNHIFSLSKKLQAPILLETSGEKNKRVYERFGFETYHSWFTDNQFTTYFLRRKA